MKPLIKMHTFGNNENWGTLIYNSISIEIRQVISGINNGLICARDCNKETNETIQQLLKLM